MSVVPLPADLPGRSHVAQGGSQLATKTTRSSAPPQSILGVPLPDEDRAREIFEEAKRIFEPETVDGVFTGTDGQPLPLHARLAKIITGLPEVKPEGENKFFKYSFVTDKQVLGLIRPKLAQQRIVIYPETVIEQEPIEHATAKDGRSMLTRLHVTFRIVDGLTGESFTGQAVGYGDDSGDKGANKAYTAALKNFLIKLFLMGGADRDIEADDETDRRARAREAGVAPVQQVEISETVVEGVARGGRSQKATEAQVATVSRLVMSTGITSPAAFSSMAEKVLGDPIELETWQHVRKYLEAMSGPDIGKIIEYLSGLADRDEASYSGYDA